MTKERFVVGVDVAKDTIAVTVKERGKGKRASFNLKNDAEQLHKALKKELPDCCKEDVLVVMEHTGVYHLKLAHALYEHGYKVAVLNPLQVKRFADAQFNRAKTDCVDSAVIAECVEICKEIRLFKPMTASEHKMKILLTHLEKMQVSLNRLKNQREALRYEPIMVDTVMESYDKLIKEVEETIQKIEEELEELADASYEKQIKLAMSVPGVGHRTACIAVSMLGCFENFDRVKAVGSYIGISPSVYESGKSVKKKGRIQKKGSAYIRKILYMGAMSAMRYNKACKALYERMIQRGKSKMQALIAVAHKLIRQVYGVLKSGIPYNEEIAMNGKKYLTN
ncbi:IS110 family RNA-guided transposase [Thermodesulfovibrio hydrogeniphilus]